MDKPWLANYPQGVPQEIDPDQYASLPALIENRCRLSPNAPAFINMGKQITYAELWNLSTAVAAYLQKSLRLPKGDRIAIMMPNLLQYPICLLAALRAGLTVVNVNPLYTARELAIQLADSGATTIIVLENFASVLSEALPATAIQHVIIAKMGDLLGMVKGTLVNCVVRYIKKLIPAWRIKDARYFKSVLSTGQRLTFEPTEVNGQDIAFLQYTGGTTGGAKGAILTHRNMVANTLQASRWLMPFALPKQQEMIVTALPLYHIFSLLANCFVFMELGAVNLLITNPRDIPGFIRELKKYPFTAITGVNTLFNALLNDLNFTTVDFSHLHLALGGGMAVQEVVAERWQAVTGVALLAAYGLTETSPGVCINPLNSKKYSPSIGLPLPSTDVKVCDESGKTLAFGEVGELYVKGPQVMQGYWNLPAETKRVLSEDGWLATGDIARIDDKGFVYIVDRKKDMIIVSGFNVYPNEVEDVVATHPLVKEVAVIGVVNETTGEQVKAFIVKRDPTLQASDLEHFCREKMTAYKVPKQFVFVAELPKSNVGKILRRALRE